jgi:integrase
MDKTVESYRISLEQEINRWNGFARALRKDDKEANRQICANKGAKNLEPEQINIHVPGMNEEDTKGLLVQFEAKMELSGYSKETMRGNLGCLRQLVVRHADLNDPISVQKALAVEEAKTEKHWSQNRRRNVINAYTLFLYYQNRTWIKPKCTVDAKFPFIPSEAEIDALIAGTHQKLATFLQLLKETAMRSGEAHRIQWINIDRGKLIVTLNNPEKHSNARMFKVSEQLIEMLNNLPKKGIYVFSGSLKGMKVTFGKARKRLALKLDNPKLLEIHFHTFRHWKATMLYHETKDIYYVQRFLGHKSIKSTEIYINIVIALFQTGPNDKFIVKVSADPKEIADYLAQGFEPQCNQGDLIFLRKRI